MDKLVRDRIPELMNQEGKSFTIKKVKGRELLHYLFKKLLEEVNELIKEQNPEEIADILEVLETICRVKGWKWEDILVIKDKKQRERGGFEKGIVISEVELREE
ncbi:MAG: phosphoribosyl-ATP pyrophosphohydrolase [Candidatus Njordarchaeales archaeon]